MEESEVFKINDDDEDDVWLIVSLFLDININIVFYNNTLWWRK